MQLVMVSVLFCLPAAGEIKSERSFRASGQSVVELHALELLGYDLRVSSEHDIDAPSIIADIREAAHTQDEQGHTLLVVHDDVLTFASGATSVRFARWAVQLRAAENNNEGVIVAEDFAGQRLPILTIAQPRVVADARGSLDLEAGDLLITPELASALGRWKLSGASIGSLRITAQVPAELAATLSPTMPPNGPTSGVSGPDVIVSDIYQSRSWGSAGDFSAFSLGTISCNIGDAQVMWVASNNQHPVIAQNLFRLKNGRFEHLGQSWIKHGFMALSEDQCGLDCIDPNDGARLGVGCSDPYTAALNGQQSILGAKSEINAFTGYFPFPRVLNPPIVNLLDRRIQVQNSDLDPALDGGGVYVVESQYVSADDAAAGNALNNASWRSATFVRIGNVWTMALLGTTVQREPAIRAWRTHDQSVTETYAPLPNEGIFVLSARAEEVVSGIWEYEYALYNLNSDRAARSFAIPRPDGALIDEIGFHDVDYRSGEVYDGTDWTPSVDTESVSWSTDDFKTNPNANALRWNTLYNFRFRSDSAPGTVQATIGLFKPGTPASLSVETVGPAGPPPVCGDEVAEGPEECDPPDLVHCDENCRWICGDSVVQDGEECDPPDGLSCDANCRWMCGDGIVQSEEECDDAGESAACDEDCTFAECGDGHTNPLANEACDTEGASLECDADCTAVVCGDELVNAAAGEECDPPQFGTCDEECQAIHLDDCEYAPLACPGTHVGTTFGTTNDGVSSCGATGTAPDTWFRYIPSTNGSATFETCGSSLDTVLAVHTGCPGTLTNQLACNDDDCILQSRITLSVVAGTEYLIRVTGYAGLMGNFSLKITGPACGCGANSDCLQPPNPCQVAACVDSHCVLQAADGAPCEDGDSCTANDSCLDLQCVGGPPPACNSLECTDCNANMVRDDCEKLSDCDQDELPDICAYGDCDENGSADICDILGGAGDCDGGPTGNATAGSIDYALNCAQCHGVQGNGGSASAVRNSPRRELWMALWPPTDHPTILMGGGQTFADLEAFLSDWAGTSRPDNALDECQVLPDCDDDGVSDGCEIGDRTQLDFDLDGQPDECSSSGVEGVDLRNLAGFFRCFSGAGFPARDGCSNFDENDDGSIDSFDFHALWCTIPGTECGS